MSSPYQFNFIIDPLPHSNRLSSPFQLRSLLTRSHLHSIHLSSISRSFQHAFHFIPERKPSVFEIPFGFFNSSIRFHRELSSLFVYRLHFLHQPYCLVKLYIFLLFPIHTTPRRLEKHQREWFNNEHYSWTIITLKGVTCEIVGEGIISDIVSGGWYGTAGKG